MQPEKLGPFQIGRVIGRGGMGAVYEGVHETSGETAAVKVLLSTLDDDSDQRLRFEAEIDTLKRLRHQNIVRLFGFGEEQGTLYYVMELVNGPSLHQELRRKRLFQWPEVAKIGCEICQALKHGHDRGVTHRDIKPANIILDASGVTKLSDYGIAHFFGGQRLTEINSVVGTLEYMSPEQALAQPAGARSDLYSLGAVLYALLIGKPPFSAKNLLEIVRQHQQGVIAPLRNTRLDTPQEFEALIFDLLQPRPENRPANAFLVAKRFQTLLQSRGEKLASTSDGRYGEIAPEATQSTPPVAEQAEPFDAAFESPDAMATDNPTIDGFQTDRRPERLASSPPPAPQPSPPSNVSDTATMLRKAQTLSAEPVSRFVSVTDQDFATFEDAEKQNRPLISLQTIFASCCLLLVGLGTHYMLQPASPDVRFGRIVKAIASDEDGGFSIRALRQKEEEIKLFLLDHPHFPQAEHLRFYLDQLDRDKLEREIARQLQTTDTKSMLPVQRAYMEAMASEKTDPDRTIAKLRALIDLFQSDGRLLSTETGTATETARPNDSVNNDEGTKERISTRRGGRDEDFVFLARRQLERLEQDIEKINAEQLAKLQMRLRDARTLEKQYPQRAASIRQAVVELYQDRDWAAEIVRDAREDLAKMQKE